MQYWLGKWQAVLQKKHLESVDHLIEFDFISGGWKVLQAHPSHGAGCPLRSKEVPTLEVLLRLAHRHRRLPVHVQGQAGHHQGRGERPDRF